MCSLKQDIEDLVSIMEEIAGRTSEPEDGEKCSEMLLLRSDSAVATTSTQQYGYLHKPGPSDFPSGKVRRHEAPPLPEELMTANGCFEERMAFL